MTIPTFPALPGLGFPIKRSPLFKTVSQEAVSGKDYRLSFWSYPRYKFEVPVDMLRTAASFSEWQAFEGFFKSCAGSAIPFHWNDVNDDSVTAQPLGTGNGTITQFAFVRTLGGFAEPIQDVTAASVQIYINGTLQTSGYTLLTDPQWGLVYAVNFTTAPASGALITGTFTYNWPCRFDNDQADLSFLYSGVFSLEKITFTTVKVM